MRNHITPPRHSARDASTAVIPRDAKQSRGIHVLRLMDAAPCNFVQGDTRSMTEV